MEQSKQQTKINVGRIIQKLTMCIVLVFFWGGSSLRAVSQEQQEHYILQIPVLDVDAALFILARKVGKSLIIPSGEKLRASSNAIDGKYTLQEALSAMLSGTSLTGGLTENGVIAISLTESNAQNRESEMLNEKLKKTLLATTSAALLAAAVPSQAQETDSQSAEPRETTAEKLDSERLFEEIIVTSTRRRTTLLETPSAITVFGEGFLDNRSIDSINDLVSLTPGLTAQPPNPFDGGNTFTIRGIQSQNLTSATVGIYLDEVAQTYSGGANEPDIRTFDLERIEVLRGPQGTLFGAGALGGAIRYISNKPDSTQFEAKIHVEGSSTKTGGESYVLDGVVNIPLVTDKLALRVTASQQETGGYIDEPLTVGGAVDDANTNNLTSVRGVLRWTPTDELTLDFQAWHQEVSTEGFNIVPTGASTPFVNDVDTLLLPHTNRNFDQYAATISYDAGWMEIVSSSSYVNTVNESEFTAGLLLISTNPFEAFSHETRFVSQHYGRFSWLAGVFYQDAKVEGGETLIPDFNASFQTNSRRKQISVYGEFNYQLTDKLQVTGGLRSFNENVVENSITDFFGGSVIQGDEDFNELLPKFLLKYQASEDLNLYASASKGFRVGGANLVTAPIDPTSFDPDDLWAYEAGAKFVAMDGRVNGGVAVFYNAWSNIQVFTRSPSGFGNLVANGGDAHIMGIEAEITVEVLEGLILGANAALMEAEFDDEAIVVGAVLEDGFRINDVPETTFAVFLDYSGEISDDVDYSIHLDGAYSGNEVGLDQREFVEGSFLVNARASFGYKNMEFGVFARNLLDDATPRRFNASYFSAPRPRTIGADMTVKF